MDDVWQAYKVISNNIAPQHCKESLKVLHEALVELEFRRRLGGGDSRLSDSWETLMHSTGEGDEA